MKKLLIVSTIIALIALIYCSSASAQYSTSNELVTIEMSDLTPAQQAKVEADKMIAKQQEQLAVYEKKIEQFGDWVGVGGEVGNAVNEGLSAVVDVADKFSQTDVGKFTLVLVAWKVMGKDVIKIILGIIFLAMFTWLLIYSFKRTCIDRRIVIEYKNPGFMKYPKEKKYELVKAMFGNGEGLGIIRIIHLILFLIGIWITYSIMFGG